MKMRTVIVSMLVAALVAASGCTTTRVVALASTASELPLLSPSTLGEVRKVTQTLQGEHDGQRFNLQSVVSVDGRQLDVIGVTAMGLRAFTLQYDGKTLTETRAPQVPQILKAERLLNDLQFAFWPLSTVQAAWSAAGVRVSEPVPGTRRLQRDGKVLAEAYYAGDVWSGRVWLRHFDDDYVLVVDTAAMEAAGT